MINASSSSNMLRAALCVVALTVVTASSTLVGAGERFQTHDGRSTITLISSGELEYRLNDGTILLCKYTDQGSALRVIMTALGTQQVLYFNRVKGGLQSTDGQLYLNASGLAELQRQEQLERRQAAVREKERAQQEAAKARAREVGTVTFKCGPVRNFSGYGTEMISVTDASVIGVSGLPDTSVAFVDVRYFSIFDADRLDGPGIWLSKSGPYNPGGSWGFRFRGPVGIATNMAAAVADRDACYDAIVSSYQKWRTKFPKLAQLPSLDAEEGAGAKRTAAAERASAETRRALADASKTIVGTWRNQFGVVEIRVDGSYQFTYEDSRQIVEGGTWSIAADVYTITQTTRVTRGRQEHLNSEHKFRIVSIDSTSYEMRDVASGLVYKASRIK